MLNGTRLMERMLHGCVHMSDCVGIELPDHYTDFLGMAIIPTVKQLCIGRHTCTVHLIWLPGSRMKCINGTRAVAPATLEVSFWLK